MGPLVVGLIAPLIASLKRSLTAFVLMAVGGLVIIFSAGYALDAAYSLLMFRYGGVAASLIIAVGLLLASLVSVGVTLYLRSRPASMTPVSKSSPNSYPPVRALISRKSRIAIAAAVAGALSAATAIALSGRLRSFVAGEAAPASASKQTDD